MLLNSRKYRRSRSLACFWLFNTGPDPFCSAPNPGIKSRDVVLERSLGMTAGPSHLLPGERGVRYPPSNECHD
jgi:hypothetical protein